MVIVKTRNETDSFWLEIIEDPDGSLNKEAILNELADYSHLMTQASLVYENLTGLSKTTYFADTIISKAEEEQSRHAKECAKDFLDHLIQEGTVKKKDREDCLLLIENYF